MSQPPSRGFSGTGGWDVRHRLQDRSCLRGMQTWNEPLPYLACRDGTSVEAVTY
ncbi:MAG: hypothetical protein R3C12_16860 [Planctomycetaceae bacterium]